MLRNPSHFICLETDCIFSLSDINEMKVQLSRYVTLVSDHGGEIISRAFIFVCAGDGSVCFAVRPPAVRVTGVDVVYLIMRFFDKNLRRPQKQLRF